MSCIHLHLGQAGNQIGKSFWGLAEEEFLEHKSVEGGGTFPSTRPSRMPTVPHQRPGGIAMFHEDSWARCLAVDSEPKVVGSFREHVGSLRPENAIISQSGLANNWAMGFASCRSDGGEDQDGTEGGLFDRCMEGMRKEAERSCWLNSIVMTHSLAGGTGSGLGSGLLQALRDEYPSLYLISTCVGPFRTGDTPLQHYNSALALQHLQAFADAVIYRGNDDLLLGAKTAVPTIKQNVPVFRTSSVRAGAVSITDMNASLSLDMGSYFFPTSRSTHLNCFTPQGTRPPPPFRTQTIVNNNQVVPRAFDGGSLMTAACPLPAAKFVDLRSSLSFDRGSSTSSAEAKGWAALAGHLAKAVPICPRKGSVLSDDVCIAAHHVVRGADSSGTNTMVSRSVGKPGVRGKNRLFTGGSGKDMAGSAAAMDEAASKASDALRKHHGCPEWRTATDVSCSPALRCREVTQSITTVCNQTRIRSVLGNIIVRAEEKFSVGAYLHWYYRYGLEKEDFLAAFEAVRTTEQGYDALAKSFNSGGGRR